MNRIENHNIFIGDQFACVSEQMTTNNIDYVLNMAPVFLPVKVQNYKQVKWEDTEEQNIFEDLENCIDFINDAVNSGKGILICCQAGRSRSGTILTAYFMNTYCNNYDNTLKYLRKYREIEPNKGFEKQLRTLEHC